MKRVAMLGALVGVIAVLVDRATVGLDREGKRRS